MKQTQKRIKLTASERESLVRLNIAYEILQTEGEHLSRRFRHIQGGPRDLAMLKAKINKLMEKVIETIPDDQLMTYIRSLKMATYTVGVKKPGSQDRNDKDFGMWLSFDIINALLSGCHDHCMMCSEEKTERKTCKLRKALSAIPNDVPERSDGDCQYYTVI